MHTYTPTPHLLHLCTLLLITVKRTSYVHLITTRPVGLKACTHEKILLLSPTQADYMVYTTVNDPLATSCPTVYVFSTMPASSSV